MLDWNIERSEDHYHEWTVFLQFRRYFRVQSDLVPELVEQTVIVDIENICGK